MKPFVATLFSIAIVVAAALLGRSYVQRGHERGTISVTGLGKEDFTSDLIVWEGSFTTDDPELRKAYAVLERDKRTIQDYLHAKAVPDSAVIFSAVETNEQTKARYTADGRYIGEDFLGYQLRQSITVESKNVPQIEELSRQITELLDQGIRFYSQPPRYYYTHLADLKVQMIAKATEDARLRAGTIAQEAGGRLGALITAKMGIFQITGQHSNEDYSWGGAFNTESKKKTASITMRLEYEAD
ncbi:MAG: SIMPL domain-containing protein [Flavobacteriales bacterium]|nr:SIMPL domain-containing protein [Flavobacteriales bacterium]MCB9165942.1 SIMPL domain-containing protein [Flavobacteriales bacterium]